MQPQRVGLFSRIDYGSPGFRKGLIEALFVRFMENDVRFAVLAGGLVSRSDLLAELNREVNVTKTSEHDRVTREKTTLPRESRRPGASFASIQRDVRERMLDIWAKDLAQTIPVLLRKGKQIKIYIVTSPANSYDGDIGKEVAIRLHNLRPDITYWDECDGRFPLQFYGEHEDMDFWVLTPKKTPWRSEYYSTGPVRSLKDKKRQSAQGAPSAWVIGCSGAMFHIPQGEFDRPVIVVPACNRLQEVQSAETEIGGCVAEFFPGNKEPKVVTHSLKDLVSFERRELPVPQEATRRQNIILKRLARGPQTIGMLDRALPWKRETIEQEITSYQTQNLQPAIIKLPNSDKYDIDKGFFQRQLTYVLPSHEGLVRDSFIAFGCLHAGYLRVQYEWFLKELPRLILQYDIERLVGAGDYIAGTKHNLVPRGEVFRGLNNTKQEKLAAEMVLIVIMKVFQARFEKIRRKKWKGDGSKKLLRSIIEESLISFSYWQGNHDKWALDESRDPLDSFNTHLTSELRRKICVILAALNFDPGFSFMFEVEEIIARKIVFSPKHTLPSGLTLAIAHPEMGRMTPSGRAQQTMAFLNDGQVVVLANFHVGIALEEWSHSLGERVTIQAPTITSGTAFEDGKNKRCDVGVYIVNIWSQEGRIASADTYFAGPTLKEMTILSSDDDYKDLLANIEKCNA